MKKDNTQPEVGNEPINHAATIELLERAISLGDADAMYRRALMHKLGQGGPVNFPAAIELFEQAILLGNADAMFSRATMHYHGQGGPVNYPAAIEFYERAIPLGHASAMFYRAWLHLHGQCGPVNYPAAIELYERAISLGHASAMNNRAISHYLGQGGPVNYPAAIKLFEQAISLDNADAMYSRAVIHYEGQDGPVNYPAAIELFERAISLGHAGAMHNRAVMHATGEGGPVNYPAAIELYERAISLGQVDAMHNRAVMHETGEGGPVNYPAAIELYERAISLGHASAMRDRALMHAEGKGEPADQKNPISAARLFLKVVKAGSSPYKENAMKKFRKLTDHSKNPELEYLYILAQYYNDPSCHAKASSACLVFLSHDDSLSQDNKISDFKRIWPNPKSLLHSLKDPEEIAAFGEFQIQIAEHALQQSYNLEGDNAAAEHTTAQSAIELAEAAREKLHTLLDAQAQKHNDQLHERLVVTLCQDRMPDVQTDPKSFAMTIADLLSFPTSNRANVMLMDIVYVTVLEPYFSSQEKRQLLLMLASRADPSGQDSTVQTLAARAKSELETNEFTTVTDGTHLITFAYLIGLATDIVHKQKNTTKDPESLANLQKLPQQASNYDPKLEEELLRHPLVYDALKSPSATYENALTQSLSPAQKIVSLAALQHELLTRLNDLGSYYQIYPKKFTSKLLTEEGDHAPASHRFFHTAGNNANSNNDDIASVKLKNTIPEPENFTAFRTQKLILKAIKDSLKNHTPTNTLISYLSFMSKSVQQSNANDAIAMKLTALSSACEPPNANLSQCAEKTFDYLSQLKLDAQPMNSIITSLLNELKFLLGSEQKYADVPASSALRDQICEALRSFTEDPELVRPNCLGLESHEQR